MKDSFIFNSLNNCDINGYLNCFNSLLYNKHEQQSENNK